MNASTALKIIEAREANADDLDIPESLRVENRRPLSPEAQAKFDAALKAAKAKPPLDDAAKVVLAEVTAKKKQKREVKKEKAVADKTGATKAMPLSGAAALAAIKGPKGQKKDKTAAKAPPVKKSGAKTVGKPPASGKKPAKAKPAAAPKAPGKPAKAPAKAKKATTAEGIRPDSKLGTIAAMLAKGATEIEMCEKLGWKRCMVTARRVAERLGKNLVGEKTKEGPTRWKLAA